MKLLKLFDDEQFSEYDCAFEAGVEGGKDAVLVGAIIHVKPCICKI